MQKNLGVSDFPKIQIVISKKYIEKQLWLKCHLKKEKTTLLFFFKEILKLYSGRT